MKLNNKGFAISTILYIILIMAVILITLTLSLLGNRKVILDKIKEEAKNNIYSIGRYANGDVVYFNVDTGEKCDNYNETQSATGIKNGCMKFYAFNDFGGDKVNLILDHNTTDYIAWNSSLINGNGPNELILQLETDTANWKGTQEPKNYTGIGCSEMLEDETSCKENSEYIINYDNKTARLITAEEIARITKNIGWTTSTGWYYLDSKKTVRLDNCTIGNTSGCNYGWLYDRTIICKQYGCLNEAIGSTVGYWTASPITIDSNYAWRISAGGILGGTKINDVENLGVRPVIEVLKSKLL